MSTWDDVSFDVRNTIRDVADVYRWWVEESIKRQERLAAALERIATALEQDVAADGDTPRRE
jgi:hypothetical protein